MAKLILILSAIFIGYEAQASLSECQHTHEDSVKKCQEQGIKNKLTNDQNFHGLSADCAKNRSMPNCLSSRSQLDEAATHLAADTVNTCDDEAKKCKDACKSENSESQDAAEIEKTKKNCLKDIDVVKSQAVAGAKANAADAPDSQDRAKDTGSGMPAMPASPSSSPSDNKDNSNNKNANQSPTTDPNANATTTPTTPQGLASAPPNVSQGQFVRRTEPMAKALANFCAQTASSGCPSCPGADPNNPNISAACAEDPMFKVPPTFSSGSPGSASAGSSGSSSSLAAAAAALANGLQIEGTPKTDAVKGLKNLDVSVNGGGGGGGSSSSSSHDPSPLIKKNSQTRKPASIASNHDVAAKTPMSVFKIASDVIHSRCERGQMLHCAPKER